MNKEIKLRAWHKKEKLMCEVSTLTNKGAFLIGVEKGEDVVSGRMTIIAPDNGRFCSHEDIELVQFTRLYDINKKPIFESDIISFEDKTSDKWILNKQKELCVVNWIQHRAAFHPQDIEKNNRDGNYIHFWEQIENIEVVGNKYSNPEKLK